MSEKEHIIFTKNHRKVYGVYENNDGLVTIKHTKVFDPAIKKKTKLLLGFIPIKSEYEFFWEEQKDIINPIIIPTNEVLWIAEKKEI